MPKLPFKLDSKNVEQNNIQSDALRRLLLRKQTQIEMDKLTADLTELNARIENGEASQKEEERRDLYAAELESAQDALLKLDAVIRHLTNRN